MIPEFHVPVIPDDGVHRPKSWDNEKENDQILDGSGVSQPDDDRDKDSDQITTDTAHPHFTSSGLVDFFDHNSFQSRGRFRLSIIANIDGSQVYISWTRHGDCNRSCNAISRSPGWQFE